MAFQELFVSLQHPRKNLYTMRMTKKLILLLVALLPMMTVAKKKPEDKLKGLFQKAMKQSKQSNGYYLVTNVSGDGLSGHSGNDIEKGNAVSVKALFQWAENNLYNIMDYSVETWDGTYNKTDDDSKNYVKNVYFLHANDPVLVAQRLAQIKSGEKVTTKVGMAEDQRVKTFYNKYKQEGDPDFSELKKNNTMIFTSPDRRWGTTVQKLNVYWSGATENGVISGHGVGMIKTGGNAVTSELGLASISFEEGNQNEVFIYFRGTFKHGIVSDKTVYRGDDRDKHIITISFDCLDPLDMTVYWKKRTEDKVVVDNMNAFRKDWLEKDLLNLEKAYNQALSIAKSNSTNVEQDKCIDRLLQCYNDLDTKGKMPLVKEVMRFYDLCTGIKFIPSRYFYREGTNIFGMHNGTYDWLGGRVKGEREILTKAVNALTPESQYGFNSFFNHYRTEITQKKEEFEDRVDTQWKDYKDWEKRYEREMSERSAQHRQSSVESRSSGSGGSSSSSSSLSSSSKVNRDADVPYSTVESYHEVWMISRPSTHYSLEKKIEFEDGTTAHIYRVPNKNYFMPHPGGGNSYNTEADAAAAAYFYKKHKLVRKKGKGEEYDSFTF